MIDIQRLRGTTVALITPFLQNGEIDESTLRKLIDWHLEAGTDVILAAGTTGESATLSHEEHHHVMDIITRQVNGRIPVICGAGSNSTREAVSLSVYAEKTGADAILSVAPYYNKPTQEGFFQHYTAIAEATRLPVIVYNVPGRTGSNIQPDTILRLAQHENIIGVKEASGNMGQIMQILRNRPDNFLVMSGDDALTLPLLAVGGDGVISVIANEMPAELNQMVHAAFDGNWERARELHNQMLPLMEMNFLETNPIPVKTALSMMGKIELNFRLPMVPMTTLNEARLFDLLSKMELVEGR